MDSRHERTGAAPGTGRPRPGMVAVLARALTAQLGELAAGGGGAPDGWWFTPTSQHVRAADAPAPDGEGPGR
jgi:hypothetical protein